MSERRIRRATIRIILLAIPFATLPAERAHSEDASNFTELSQAFIQAVHPTLQEFCLDCHSTNDQQGELDLQQFGNLADIRQQPKVWQKVAAMLANGEMPPKESPQPTIEQRRALRTWVESYLDAEALAAAGDPGPVVLRRLSNAEYNYTIADLTGVDTLDPTRQFPVDGAAGEGFTNSGNAQAMSPSLVQKYLDAAKAVAAHVVLLPGNHREDAGIRFSPYSSRRDQTDELITQIQSFYRTFCSDNGSSSVTMDGINLETTRGGLLPVEDYLDATLAERDAISSGEKTVAQVADERGLNAKYLTRLFNTLSDDSRHGRSVLIDALREQWRSADESDAATLAADVVAAQQSLWKLNTIGHIGRADGPQSWMTATGSASTRREFRRRLPEPNANGETLLYLSASDLSDGNEQDYLVWENPRLEFPAEDQLPPIPLRDVRAVAQQVESCIDSELARTHEYLRAVRVLYAKNPDSVDREAFERLAAQRKLNPRLLQRWADYVQLTTRSLRKINGLYAEKQLRVHGYDAINGWGHEGTPSLLTNQADDPITFLTLTVPARGVVVHPSPTLESVVAWRCPLEGKLLAGGLVADADDKCGNGAAWRLEHWSETGTTRLAGGEFDNGSEQNFIVDDPIIVHPGEVVALVVNARDANHVCDTTHVALTLTQADDKARVWDLATDVVDKVSAGNPLSDSYGNLDVWHFAATPSSENSPPELSIPPRSSLERWRQSVIGLETDQEIDKAALKVRDVLNAVAVESLDDPDRVLRRHVIDWRGPLRWTTSSADTPISAGGGAFGLDPSIFGRHPAGAKIAPTHLCVQAPTAIAIRLPSALGTDVELVTAASLHPETGRDGSVQPRLTLKAPDMRDPSLSMPIVVGGGAAQRIESSLDEFRTLFPAALCYARIVPVDEVVTLTLFHRDDDHLKRLMLDEAQSAQIDRMWDELYFVSQEPLQLVVAHEQISEFATQDRPDLVKAFAPMGDPIKKRAERFRQRLIASESGHLQAVIDLADRAWRRPLTKPEVESIRALYQSLRADEIGHDPAIRLTIARILASPAMLYRREKPVVGDSAGPVTDVELATRLSYFLWSSVPDAELRLLADQGRLTHGVDGGGGELLPQTRRMLKDGRTRRLAIEFACQWLHLRQFVDVEKNERLFPGFASLRSDMYEESVRFFEDMFRNDGSILDLIEADHTFLNESLAGHYGIDGVVGDTWRRVDDVRSRQRGGILAMAAVLASQSGASRTSPILRGNWIYETLLGQRLPRPPAGVPQLPDVVPSGKTARQLIELHSSAPECSKCHERIDRYGFALEKYDAIGRIRQELIDVKTTLPDGATIDGLEGLRDYLAGKRRDEIIHQFCRKLLGYALGREVQLSDRPLITEMKQKLSDNQYRFSIAVEAIVNSQQFRQLRGEPE